MTTRADATRDGERLVASARRHIEHPRARSDAGRVEHGVGCVA
jgi:hypothetical protein